MAAVYPAVMRRTWRADVARFARLARVVDPGGVSMTEQEAAERCVEAIEVFLDRIGMRLTLDALGVPHEELPALAHQSLVLPDYKNHPKVVDIDEVEAILAESFGGRVDQPLPESA